MTLVSGGVSIIGGGVLSRLTGIKGLSLAPRRLYAGPPTPALIAHPFLLRCLPLSARTDRRDGILRIIIGRGLLLLCTRSGAPEDLGLSEAAVDTWLMRPKDSTISDHLKID